MSLPLLELLSAHAVSVAYADGPADPRPAFLPSSAIQPVGFAPEEALFPWPARSFSGFRLLTEYFAFPEKFQFLDFTGIETKTLLRAGRRLDIFVYLNRTFPELERSVGADTLALGCTPVVNLFSQGCEPIALSHTDTEYRVVPDARRPAAMEVWQVERVRETQADGKVRRGSPSTACPPWGKRRPNPVAGTRRSGGRPRSAGPKLFSAFAIPISIPTSLRMPCCRSMRFVSIATFRLRCRLVVVIRYCNWSRATPRSGVLCV